MVANSEPNPPKSVSRSERYWIVAAVIFAAIVRLSFPGRMAVEHFDEAVYSSNIWFGVDAGYAYPARHLYAPPLLPLIIEWTMVAVNLFGFKPTGFVPMVPCLIAGLAMVPSIWWVVRRWFGTQSGMVSAWLVATSDFHACYSRTALTDVPVCLFMLWAVYFTSRAFSTLSEGELPVKARKKAKSDSRNVNIWLARILLAGLFTGIAWWTKYNGWLPLAIGLSGGILWQMLTPATDRKVLRLLATWSLIAAVAVLIWTPVLWGLQSHGGYQAVAANHRQYLVGLAGWTNSARTQLDNLGFYENPFDVFAGAIGTSIGAAVIPWLSLVVSLTVCLRAVSMARSQMKDGPARGIPGDSRLLTACLFAAWFFGLSVATPLYHPYPRLVLPWVCSTWIWIGAAFRTPMSSSPLLPASTTPLTGNYANKPSNDSLIGVSRILVLSLVFFSATRLFLGSAHAWNDRSDIQAVAIHFASTVKKETAKSGFPDSECFVYVLGEPAIVFGLKSEGLPLVGPVQDLGFSQRPIQRPTFLVFSSESSEMTDDQRELLMSQRFERVDSKGMVRSHLVLNERIGRSSGADEMNLYRLRK